MRLTTPTNLNQQLTPQLQHTSPHLVQTRHLCLSPLLIRELGVGDSAPQSQGLVRPSHSTLRIASLMEPIGGCECIFELADLQIARLEVEDIPGSGRSEPVREVISDRRTNTVHVNPHVALGMLRKILARPGDVGEPVNREHLAAVRSKRGDESASSGTSDRNQPFPVADLNGPEYPNLHRSLPWSGSNTMRRPRYRFDISPYMQFRAGKPMSW